MELIDVSKWFSGLKKINPEFLVAICLCNLKDAEKKPKDYYFSIGLISGAYFLSNYYDNEKTAQYEMEQFCKKLQGDK